MERIQCDVCGKILKVEENFIELTLSTFSLKGLGWSNQTVCMTCFGNANTHTLEQLKEKLYEQAFKNGQK